MGKKRQQQNAEFLALIRQVSADDRFVIRGLLLTKLKRIARRLFATISGVKDSPHIIGKEKE